jgi:hypothetical protein
VIAPAWDRDALLASPLLATVRPLLARLAPDRFPTLDDLNALARERDVRSGGGAPIEFVPAEPARARALDARYEIRIFRAGRVTTREGSWHDLFNALAWITFPRTKAAINRLHHDEMLRRPDARERGTARDALTLLDEGGVIVACADPSLERLLAGFRWKELFWTRRDDVAAAMRFLVLGHAIHEKALAPYKGVTAKALVVPTPVEVVAGSSAALAAVLDERAAARLAAPGALASTRAFHPLPILGIPGWTAENGDPAYYDDAAVFRPGRRGERKQAPAGA